MKHTGILALAIAWTTSVQAFALEYHCTSPEGKAGALKVVPPRRAVGPLEHRGLYVWAGSFQFSASPAVDFTFHVMFDDAEGDVWGHSENPSGRHFYLEPTGVAHEFTGQLELADEDFAKYQAKIVELSCTETD